MADEVIGAPGPARPDRAERWRGRIRRHGGFGVVLVLAAGLRAVVQLAYAPALFIPDSGSYLAFASRVANGELTPGGHRVSGYAFALLPYVLGHNLPAIVATQHLLGLASGVLIYALLLARGAHRRLAVLASVPVLFDPLQLNVEQYVLAETLATFLLLAAVAVLAWPGRWRWRRPVVAGVLLAGATLSRTPDLVVAAPALVYVLLACRPWRRAMAYGGALAGALVVALAVPLAAYTSAANIDRGGGTVTGIAQRFLYARLAPVADCSRLDLSRAERNLCPTGRPGRRPGPNYYMWSTASPFLRLRPPAGTSTVDVVRGFNRQVLLNQPLSYAGVVAAGYLYGFSPVRGSGPDRLPSWVYKFQSHYTAWNTSATAISRAYGDTRPMSRPGLQRFLHAYGHFYVPGPVLGAGLVLGLAAAVGLGPARRSGQRATSFLFAASAATVLVPGVALSLFSWRYQQPQMSLIPLAAVTGLVALVPRFHRTPAKPVVAVDERPPASPVAR